MGASRCEVKQVVLLSMVEQASCCWVFQLAWCPNMRIIPHTWGKLAANLVASHVLAEGYDIGAV